MTRDGFPGVIDDVLEGPADVTYFVTLDNNMGGGEYDEGEVWPLTDRVSSATFANVDHTAADDYPELSEILVDRPPLTITTHAGAAWTHPEEPDYDAMFPGIAPEKRPYICAVPIDGKTHWRNAENCPHCDAEETRARDAVPHRGPTFLDYFMHGLFPSGAMGAMDEAAAKIALTLPLDPQTDPSAHGATPQEQQGYSDGMSDGKAGVTRNFRGQVDPNYRAGYDSGWAFGVQTTRKPLVDDVSEEMDIENEQVVMGDPIIATLGQLQTSIHKDAGAIWDVIKGNTEPYKGYLTYDWCRYRRDGQCYYSKNLDVPASKEAGYAVWIPENRGSCFRAKWEAQQQCPMAMPGPHVPGGFTNATVPYEQGGQHGGSPTNTYRSSLIREAQLEPSFAFHLTAAWRDVQAKAKRIRSEDGVRLIAAKDGTFVGHIRGDTNVYEAEIVNLPGRHTVGAWNCGCKWAAYSWGRSGPWKKYEGRMCSHALALSYEIQSRGSHGREITLDERQPQWMDPTLPVRTPNTYDRNKGRYSALGAEGSCPGGGRSWGHGGGKPICPTCHRGWRSLGLSSEPSGGSVPAHNRQVASSLRPAVEQDDVSPMTMVVAGMLAEGIRYGDIREFAKTAGVEDVPSLVKQAKKFTPFAAKVWGIIRSLFIDDSGLIRDEDTKDTYAAKDVLFPDWDPVKGLDYRPPTEASLVKEASPADDLAKTQSLDEAAETLLDLARREEPHTTSEMQRVANHEHGELEGLDNRFKSKGSLLRKMTAESGGRKPGQVAMGMSDALRYTMLLPYETYTTGAEDAISQLERDGFGTRVKNYWVRGDAYNGINVALTTPDGLPVELQFHTQASIDCKLKNVHPIYEQWRSSKDPWERIDLADKMRRAYDQVPVPKDVLDINAHKVQPAGLFDFKAATKQDLSDDYRYVHTDTGWLVRFPADDSSAEVWLNGEWVHHPEFGRYNFLGEPCEPISEAEANSYIIQGIVEPAFGLANPDRVRVASADSAPTAPAGWDGAAPVACDQYVDDPERPGTCAQCWWTVGSHSPAAGGPTGHGADSYYPSVLADLHDDPEPALPSTDGADEDEDDPLTWPWLLPGAEPPPLPPAYTSHTEDLFREMTNDQRGAHDPLSPADIRAVISDNEVQANSNDFLRADASGHGSVTMWDFVRGGDDSRTYKQADADVQPRYLTEDDIRQAAHDPAVAAEIAASLAVVDPASGVGMSITDWLGSATADLGVVNDSGQVIAYPDIAGVIPPVQSLWDAMADAPPYSDGTQVAMVPVMGTADVGPTTDAEAMAMGLQDDVSEAREDLGLPPLDASLEAPTQGSEADRARAILAQFDQWKQEVAAGVTPTVEHPFSHHGLSGGADNEIMAAAQAKVALKTYNPSEKQAIINEGEGSEGATNFDRMDISGTHYEALEAAQATKAATLDDDPSLWFLTGNPNDY